VFGTPPRADVARHDGQPTIRTLDGGGPARCRASSTSEPGEPMPGSVSRMTAWAASSISLRTWYSCTFSDGTTNRTAPSVVGPALSAITNRIWPTAYTAVVAPPGKRLSSRIPRQGHRAGRNAAVALRSGHPSAHDHDRLALTVRHTQQSAGDGKRPSTASPSNWLLTPEIRGEGRAGLEIDVLRRPSGHPP